MLRVQHRQLMAEAYTLYSHTNPLHGDVFPSVRRMEAEVVAMTAAMLGGDRSRFLLASCQHAVIARALLFWYHAATNECSGYAAQVDSLLMTSTRQ